jgi:4-hydroxybenzoate polyprenyltransferase
MRNYIKLLRPVQWTKNFAVLAVLLFSKNLFRIDLLCKTILGVIVFCIVSSCVYIINDIVDKEKDRNHSKKRFRPIASGKISVRNAIVFLMILGIPAFGGAYYLSWRFGLAVTTYFILNVSYSFRLKNVAILDIMCVALGFVIRVLSGAFLISAYISPWLILCTLLLSLFLAIQKRRGEITTNSSNSRTVLNDYTEKSLAEMGSVVDSATVVAYSLYCVGLGDMSLMMLTIPIVIYGLFRYKLISNLPQSLIETPELILIKDKPMIACVLIWVILCFISLYCIGGIM